MARTRTDKTEARDGRELVNALTRDWLERDGDTFVKIRKTGRIGWEEMLASGAAFSSYLLEAPTAEDLFIRAYSLARQTISAMDTPFKTNVRLSATGSCTEGKNVYVATDYFDDKDIPVGKKLDIFLGLTVHEGGHLLYTQFDQMGKAAAVHPLCANLLNIIEDERIERMLGEEKPGLANYLGAVKEHYFGKYAGKDKKKSGKSRMENIVNCILGLIRYPRILRESDMVEFGELLLKAREILTPYPSSTTEAERAAEKIYHLIRDEYGKDAESHRLEGGKPEEGEETAGPAHDTRPAGYGADKSGDFEGDYREIAEDISEVASAPVQAACGASLTDDRISGELKKENGLLADICEGRVETGSSHEVLFHRESGNAERYNRALSMVKQYVPAIRRTIKGHSKKYEMVHLGMRSGLLDTNKLVEAVQGVPTVYKRQGEVKSDTATVCVLIDESGSMIREGRMDAARQTAVLLNEALSGIPNIELFFYGHTADVDTSGRTELRIYREKGYCPKHALGALDARDNNRDGVAILETAMRVRKQTDEKEVLMFIISDGAPAAQGYIGREAIAHTKACVEQAERMGFHIVQICINASYDPALMFRHYIKMEELSSLAHDLGKVIAKTLVEKINTTII